MKEYTAFISYSSLDKKWAQWLKVRLDKFSCIKVSKEKHPLRYVFLDKYNLGVDPLLDKGLKENLQKSTFLIIVCSPNTPASKYVKYEINEFKRICAERGNDWKQYVIPVVVSSADTKCCFPESIRDIKAVTIKNYWAVNSKAHAIAVIAAKILGITNPDKIRNYLIEIQRRKIIFYSIISLMILCGIYVYWEFTRINKVYYVDYVPGIYQPGKNKNWAEGIGKLTSDETKTLNSHYRLEYKRIPLGKPDAGQWQLKRIIHANPYNYPIDYEENNYPFPRFPIQEINYSSEDIHKPENIHYYDTHHKLQLIARLSGEKLNKIDIQNFQSELAFSKQTLSDFEYPIFEMMGNKYANITHFEIIRNYLGQVKGVKFKANNGLNTPPMPDTRKHTTVIFGLDSIGRILRCYYLTYDNIHKYTVEYEYDQHNLLASKNLYNGDLKDYSLIISHTYKRENNVVQKFIYKDFDKITKKIVYIYKKGMLISQETIDCITTDGMNGVATFANTNKSQIIKYEYNEKGFPIKIKYNDSMNPSGIIKYITYTPDNYIKEINYRTFIDKKTSMFEDGPEGYYRIYYVYDKNKMLIESLCERKSPKQKYYQVYKYDKANRLRSILFTDTIGNPINIGDFKKVQSNDPFEKDANQAYIDLFHKRNTNKNLFSGDTLLCKDNKFPMFNGFAKRELTYDEYGNIKVIKYYDKKHDCFYMIEEKILENGFVPYTVATLVNKDGIQYPFTSEYAKKKGDDSSMPPEIISMIYQLINHNQKDR